MTTIAYSPELGEKKPENINGEVDFILGKYFVETSETIEIKRGIRYAYRADNGNNVYEMTKVAYRTWSANKTIAKCDYLD